MSREGVVLISRVALVAFLILVTAVVRTLVGPSRRRGLYMGFGTVGALAAGIAAASLKSRWIIMDISVIFGIFAGWGVAWLFARRIPREAN
jgi:hypothetical protein